MMTCPLCKITCLRTTQTSSLAELRCAMDPITILTPFTQARRHPHQSSYLCFHSRCCFGRKTCHSARCQRRWVELPAHGPVANQTRPRDQDPATGRWKRAARLKILAPQQPPPRLLAPPPPPPLPAMRVTTHPASLPTQPPSSQPQARAHTISIQRFTTKKHKLMWQVCSPLFIHRHSRQVLCAAFENCVHLSHQGTVETPHCATHQLLTPGQE